MPEMVYLPNMVNLSYFTGKLPVNIRSRSWSKTDQFYIY